MLVDVPEWRRDILLEHLEELEALWNRRSRALRSPEADALALRRIDARMDAHADALALAGEHAWPLLEPALAGEPPAAAAAALALASTNEPEADRALVSALEQASAPIRSAIGRAFELRAGAGLCRLLPLGPTVPPAVAAISCAVLVTRRPIAAAKPLAPADGPRPDSAGAGLARGRTPRPCAAR